MKIAVLGIRGFPDVQGGVEVHCEKLYPRLAKLGCSVTVFTRKPYVNPEIKSHKNVNLIPLDCPKSRSFEAIIHTFKGIFAAKKMNPDMVHIHAVGPSLLVPLARILGLRTIMTNHGPDYKREKWGCFAKFVLRLGERMGSCFANEIICISKGIADDIRKKYKRNPYIIPNGIEIPEILKSDETLRKYGLQKNKYILAVGRFVPEKGFSDLVDAFNKAELKGWKLVIVGRADHESKYSRSLEEKTGKNPDIILTGFLTGIPLQEVYSYAGLFVLPSYYEGLPITLLEATSYGLLCLVSDIPANRCLPLPAGHYFRAGGSEQLSEKIKKFSIEPIDMKQKVRQTEILKQKYDWDTIAKSTLEVYNKVIGG